MYLESIPCNNDNQDIVSMGSNSASKTFDVLENGFQVASILATAIVEASDFLEDENDMSTSMKSFKGEIRKHIPEIDKDLSYVKELKSVQEYLKNIK